MTVNTDININEFIESHDWTKQLLLFHSNENKDLFNKNITEALCHIFSLAFKSFKSSPATIDMIHRDIINYISNSDCKLQICTHFLQCLSEINLDTQNEIDGLNLIQYYHKLIDEIISPKRLNASSYDCLAGIAKFNALIIEEKLPAIFKKILYFHRESDGDRTSYITLLNGILDACTRLRRETKLIPLILMAIDQKNKKKYANFDTDNVLPKQFLNKFTNTVSSMTNAQIVRLLMSFTYHLELLNIQLSERTSFTTIQAASKLIVAFLEGVNIFDNNTKSMQQKFVNNFVKFGNVLEKLVEVVLLINDNGIILVSTMEIINSWESVVALIKKYAPDAFTEESSASIFGSVERIHKVIDIKELTSCTDAYVLKLIACSKLEERKIYENPPLMDTDVEILDKVENYWQIIFEKYPHLISHLNDSQIESLTFILLNNINFDENNLLKTTKITHFAVQNHQRLITELIFGTFCILTKKLTDLSYITTTLLNIITKKRWESKKMPKILKNSKELLLNDPQWTQIESKLFTFIAKYLQILLILPIIHISIELRTIIFLITFVIGKECKESKIITDLCSQIISDTSENPNIDILQYIRPEYLINDLQTYPSIINLLQYSLRNVSNYEAVQSFIKNNKTIENCAAPILIQSIEKIKPRLKATEKRAARKIEKKLSKRILKAIEGGVKTAYEVKCLTAAVKVAIVTKKVDESLLEKINSTLDSIFRINNKKLKIKHDRENANSLVEEGLQLITLILLHQSHIPIDKKIRRCIWMLMLRNASKDIMKNLFGVTNSKLLKKILSLLQKQIVSSIEKNDDSLLQNSLQVWCSIANANMGNGSNLIRHNYLQAFLRFFCDSKMPSEYHPTILKICDIIIRCKRCILPEKTIDLILFTINNFTNNPDNLTINLCNEIIEICSSFLKFRADIMSNRLSELLYIYRRVMKFIINESRMNNSEHQRELECISLNAQKLVIAFVKLKKDILRITAYTVADLVEIYSYGVIPAYVKEPLDESVSMFLSICDQHAICLLLRVLPVSMQEIFKTLYNNYNKFYKFTGKI